MTTDKEVRGHNHTRSMPSATFRLPASQVEALRQLAGANQVSQSHLVREALDAAFRRWGRVADEDDVDGDAAQAPFQSTTAQPRIRIPAHLRRPPLADLGSQLDSPPLQPANESMIEG